LKKNDFLKIKNKKMGRRKKDKFYRSYDVGGSNGWEDLGTKLWWWWWWCFCSFVFGSVREAEW